MIYFNSHTHIFSGQYVPNNVVGVPIMNFMSRYPIAATLSRFFARIRFGAIDSQLERVTKFASIGLGTSQETIFNTLEEYYNSWGDVRFVILTMDMEQMGAGKPMGNYRTQLEELVRIRARGHYANKLLPFLFVDPRRPEFVNGKVLVEWVKPWFERYGFCGIKMYPALGYYPFDEKLDELYDWAEAKQVPILYHCIQGVIHYRGSLNGFPKPRHFIPEIHNLNLKEGKAFQANFTHPLNYKKVLERNPRLKICLAHYGGEEELTRRGPNKGAWYDAIRNLMVEYKNVYTDISFTLHDQSTFPIIAKDMKDPAVQQQVLFGTDYYVVQKDKDEGDLRDELRAFLNAQSEERNLFDLMAAENPRTFLRSSFYSV